MDIPIVVKLETKMNRLSLGRFFRRYFVLVLLLWILFVLYPNPANLIISIERVINPPIDLISVRPLSQELTITEPAAIEMKVQERILYRYDWEVYGMPWYFPTVTKILENGEGDCKARALILASILEDKEIPYHINCSPIHMWVEYAGKGQTTLENADVRFYQQDPQTGERAFRLPDIPFSDILDSFKESFWEPMPTVRKVLLVFGLPALVIIRLTLLRQRKGKVL